MPKYYRAELDEADRHELKRRTRDRSTRPRTRERLEMIRLSTGGWDVPRIAQHFGTCDATARRWIRAFLSGGFDALTDQPHLGEPSCLTPDLLQAVANELAKGQRTWTAQQVADWLAQEHDVRVSAKWMSHKLRQAGLSYKRTARTLQHKRKPEQVASKAADLETIEKGGTPA